MERILELYQSPNMNKEWLVTDWKNLCLRCPNTDFMLFLLDVFDKISSRELKNVKTFLNEATFWQNIELPTDLLQVENFLNSLQSAGVLSKQSIHHVLEIHGADKSNMDL